MKLPVTLGFDATRVVGHIELTVPAVVELLARGLATLHVGGVILQSHVENGVSVVDQLDIKQISVVQEPAKQRANLT